MNEYSDASTTEPGANAPGLMDTVQFLAAEFKVLGKEFFAMASAEVALAAKSLPKLIAMVFAALFFAVTSWLSVCAAVAFCLYAMTGWAWLGFVSFALFQVGALYGCKILIERYAHYLSLPYSRQFFKDLQRGRHEPSTESA